MTNILSTRDVTTDFGRWFILSTATWCIFVKTNGPRAWLWEMKHYIHPLHSPHILCFNNTFLWYIIWHRCFLTVTRTPVTPYDKHYLWNVWEDNRGTPRPKLPDVQLEFLQSWLLGFSHLTPFYTTQFHTAFPLTIMWLGNSIHSSNWLRNAGNDSECGAITRI